MENISAILICAIIFGFFAYLINMHYDSKKSRLKSDIQHKLVEKYSNVKDLNELLKSDAGIKFFNSLTFNGFSPKNKLISTINRGIVLSFIGLSCIYLAFTLVLTDDHFFHIIGIIILAAGLGTLLSSVISYILSKKWDLIDTNKEDKK